MKRLTRQAAEHRLEVILRVLYGHSGKHFSDVEGLVRWFENHVETRRLVDARRSEDLYKQDSLCVSTYFVKGLILNLQKDGVSFRSIMDILWITSLMIEKETERDSGD